MVEEFSTRFTTVWILICFAVVLGVWDIWVIWGKRGKGSTISEVMLSWARRHTWFVFLCGSLAGHLFWPQIVQEVCK